MARSFTKPTHKELHEYLQDLVDWESFALHLPCITSADILIIKAFNGENFNQKKNALYSKWLQVCAKPSWADVITALEVNRENKIADSLKRKIKSQCLTVETISQADEIKVKEEVVKKLQELHTSFVSLQEEVHKEIEQKVNNKDISIVRLKQRTREQSRACDILNLDTVETTEQYFKVICPYYHFLNSHLITSLAPMLSVPTADKIKEYQSKVVLFKKSTRVRHLHNTLHHYLPSTSTSTHVKVIIKVVYEFDNHNLWLVETLVQMLLGVRGEGCSLYRVIPGSLFLVFLMQKNLLQSAKVHSSKAAVTTMKLLGIIRFQIANTLIFSGQNDCPFSFNDSLIEAAQLDDVRAVSFLLQYMNVNIDERILQYSPPLKFDKNEIEKTKIIHKLRKYEQNFFVIKREIERRLSSAVNEDHSITIQELVKKLQSAEFKDGDHFRFPMIELAQVKTTNEFIQCIEPYYNFFNSSIIQYIGLLVKHRDVNTYRRNLCKLKQTLTLTSFQQPLQNLIQEIPPPPNIAEVKIYLTTIWETFTIERTEILVENIFAVFYPNELLWYNVSYNPLTIVFIIPNNCLMLLIVNAVKNITLARKTGIIKIQIGNVCVNGKKDIATDERDILRNLNEANKANFSKNEMAFSRNPLIEPDTKFDMKFSPPKRKELPPQLLEKNSNNNYYLISIDMAQNVMGCFLNIFLHQMRDAHALIANVHY